MKPPPQILLPRSRLSRRLEPWYTVASYLFIPTGKELRGNDVSRSRCRLDLELRDAFFYFLFAAALALEISPLRFLAPCLGHSPWLDAAHPRLACISPRWPSTLVIEFLYGVIHRHAVTRRKAASARLALPLLGAGFAALLLMPPNQDVWRLLIWGLPAAAVVTATVALEDLYGARLPKLLLEIGDASDAPI